MKAKITKICAIGTNQRFMWILVDDKEYGMRISRKLYDALRIKGIKTSQSLRSKKRKPEMARVSGKGRDTDYCKVSSRERAS